VSGVISVLIDRRTFSSLPAEIPVFFFFENDEKPRGAQLREIEKETPSNVKSALATPRKFPHAADLKACSPTPDAISRFLDRYVYENLRNLTCQLTSAVNLSPNAFPSLATFRVLASDSRSVSFDPFDQNLSNHHQSAPIA
jgi:hypothetical protein